MEAGIYRSWVQGFRLPFRFGGLRAALLLLGCSRFGCPESMKF